jgi:hypothetical protein
VVLPDDSGVTGASLGVDNLRDEVCRQALRSNRVLISGIPLKLFVYVITKLTKQLFYEARYIFYLEGNFQRVGHFFYITNLSFVIIITCELIINLIEYIFFEAKII